MIDYRRLRVALLGAGAVGVAGRARCCSSTATSSPTAPAPRLELVGIAVRDLDAPRDADLPRELLTTDAESLILGADIVIELMGGIEPARTLPAAGDQLRAPTSSPPTRRCSPPTVPSSSTPPSRSARRSTTRPPSAGAIPIIRPLRDSLAGDRVQRIMGIVNGTTNYILDRMDTEGADFDDVLADAPASSATPRPTRPPTSRATTPRRRPRSSRASPSTRRCRSTRCTARASRAIDTAIRSTPPAHAGYVVKLLAVCERLADADDRRRGRSRCASTRRSFRRDHPLAACTAPTTRCSSRRRPPATSCSTARAPAACRPRPPCSATSSRPPAATSPAAPASPSRRTPNLPIVADRPASRPGTRSPSRSTTSPACSRPIAGIFSDDGVSVETRRADRVDDPVAAASPAARLVIGTHKAPEQDLSRHRRPPRRQRRRRARRVGAASRRRLTMAHVWRGVLREYADRLGRDGRLDRRHPRRGRHAAPARARRCRAAPAPTSGSSSRA